jgi:hypothetical protein
LDYVDVEEDEDNDNDTGTPTVFLFLNSLFYDLTFFFSHKTTLFSCMTPNAGSTKSGTLYIMKYTNDFGNLCSTEVDRPSVISHFFGDSNTIDSHNQSPASQFSIRKKSG